MILIIRRGGYLTVQESPWRTPLALAFIQAGHEIGYDNVDINGASQTGFMLAQGTLRRGSRCSTAKAFLRYDLILLKSILELEIFFI